MKPLHFLWVLLILFFLGVGMVWFYVQSIIAYGLPSIDQLENPTQNLATQVISSDGELLDLFSIQRRIYLGYDSIPKDFLNGLIAVEDRSFYDHWGVHIARVMKAAIKNIMAGGIKEGASTITMQLARNLFLNRRTTLERKIQEAFIAAQIEQTYTKEEILELYANTVIFGRGAYGIQVASEIYFNKPPQKLTTAECAFLVGILKNPENYNGMVDYDRAIRRRDLVLDLMEQQDFITSSELAIAKKEPLSLSQKQVSVDKRFMSAPHFVEMIRQNLTKNRMTGGKDLYRDGLIIYSTLNSRIQKHVNDAINEHMSEFQKLFDKRWSWSRNSKLLDELIKEAIHGKTEYIKADKKTRRAIEKKYASSHSFVDSIKNAATTIQCAAVVIDPFKGNILAMIGGSPKFMNEHPDARYSLNHATQIQRQPGSVFKPIIYACALETGLDPDSKISRGPFSYTDPYTGEVWRPRGMGKDISSDSVSLYTGLVQSINTVSARLITEVTNPSRVVSAAYRMGITSRLEAVPALALGAGGEVIPLDMVSAFGTFLNKGIHIKPFSIYYIEDSHGNIIQKQRKTIKATDVFSPKIADIMVYLMSAVVDRGTGSAVRRYFRDCDAAGKTGTTNDYADAWFIGYTPELLAGVWLGFDDRRVTFTSDYGYASYAAAPLWGKIMRNIYNDDKLQFDLREFEYKSADSSDSDSIERFILRKHIESKKMEEKVKNDNN